MKKRKIIVAVTGASGSIYAGLLIDRISGAGDQAQSAGHGAQGAELGAQSAELGAQGPGRRAEISGRRAQGPGRRAQGTGHGADVAIIFSENAKEIWKFELGSEFRAPGGVTLYENNDFYAPFASGSSDWDTMIICPASMGIIGRIAAGISNDLITRTADVMLKERRKLIVVPRETPYSLIHLNNMKLITEAGAIVCPATPSFYHKPATIEELALTVVERVLDLASVPGGQRRWQTT